MHTPFVTDRLFGRDSKLVHGHVCMTIAGAHVPILQLLMRNDFPTLLGLTLGLALFMMRSSHRSRVALSEWQLFLARVNHVLHLFVGDTETHLFACFGLCLDKAKAGVGCNVAVARFKLLLVLEVKIDRASQVFNGSLT